jgi:hypothetical protein
MFLTAVLASLLALSAHASDDDDDLFTAPPPAETKKKDDVDAKSFEDKTDIEIAPTATIEAKTAIAEQAFVEGTSKLPFAMKGKVALGDNYEPQIVFTDKSAVVIELPVIYATDRTLFDGMAFWVVAEAWTNGKKVAEQRVQVTRDSVASGAPSIHFFRMFTPVDTKEGDLELRVGKADSPAKKSTNLFTRTVHYKL